MDTLIIDIEDDFLFDSGENDDNTATDDKTSPPQPSPVTAAADTAAVVATSAVKSSSWCESTDDDDDDNIIVTVNHTDATSNETERLNRVLEYSYYPTFTMPPAVAASAVYQLRSDDIELNNEIDRLIATSVNLRTSNVITVFVRNTLILVPIRVPISSRLADCIWPVAKSGCGGAARYNTATTPYIFQNVDVFNGLLPETERLETMAFFAARYTKKQLASGGGGSGIQCYRPPIDHRDRLSPPVAQNVASGQYFYDDFTLVIVDGGKVVDVAIHGRQGNINDLVAKYRPRRIYCNTRPGDALDVFLHYPYQPFYRSFEKLMVPFFVDTTKTNINTAPFCDRYDTYCSFCKTLLTVNGFFTPRQYWLNSPRFVQGIRPANVDAPHDSRRSRRRRPETRPQREEEEIKRSSYSVVVVVEENNRRVLPMTRPGRNSRSCRRSSFVEEYDRKVASTVPTTTSSCGGRPKIKQRKVVVLQQRPRRQQQQHNIV